MTLHRWRIEWINLEKGTQQRQTDFYSSLYDAFNAAESLAHLGESFIITRARSHRLI